jgi:hypothetical protein
VTEDGRRHRREKYDDTFYYQVSVLEFKNLRKIQSSGMYVDTSEGGVGFITDFALEPGQVIRILKENSYQPALVKWVSESDGRYRAGGKYL